MYMHLVALRSQRAARHTQQRFVLWLRRLHELANPWKWFKCLADVFGPMSREVLEPTFSLSLWFGVSPLREAVFGVPRLCERRVFFDPDSARSIVAQIEKCSSSSVRHSVNPLLSACTRRLCLLVFPLSRG